MKPGEDDEDVDMVFEPQYDGVLGQRLWELQQQGILCDIHVEADGKSLPVHSIVLGASSPFILQLLHKKECHGHPLDTIRLTGVNFNSCLEIMKYLYLGKLTLGIENVYQIHKVCTLWEVCSGVKRCAAFLASLKDAQDHKEPGKTDVKTEVIRKSAKTQKSRNNNKWNGSLLSYGRNETPSITGVNCHEHIPSLTQPRIVTNCCTTDTTEIEENVSSAVLKGTKCEVVKQISHEKQGCRSGRGQGAKSERGKVPQTSELSSNDHCDISNQCLDETEQKECCDDNRQHSPLSERTATDEHTSKRRKTTFEEKDTESSGDSISCDDTVCGDKPELQCRQCNKSFPTPEDLSKHNISCKHRKCRHCHLIFESNEELQEHRKVHQKKRVRKRYKCEVCNRDFASLEFLKSHKFTKHWTEDMGEPNYYYCEEEGCDFKALRRCQLYQHKIQHQTDRPFMCDVCGATYKNKYYLKQHVQQCHPESGQQFTCDQCQQVFKRQRDLRNHIKRVHNKEFPYMCNQCPHRKASKSELNMHMFYKHDVPLPKAKINTCTYCGYKAPCQSVMVTHMQRHNTEKLFQCGICGKSYNTEKDLKYHFKRHNADRKHKCNLCNYTTAYGQKRLQDHIQNMHKDKDHKPWKCYVCDYKSNLKGNLTQHLRKVHKLTVKTNQHLVKKMTSPQSDTQSDQESMAEKLGQPVLSTSGCSQTNVGVSNSVVVRGLEQQQQGHRDLSQHPQALEIYAISQLYRSDQSMATSTSTAPNLLPQQVASHGPILSAPPTIVTTSHGPILAAPPTIVTTSPGPILSTPPTIVTTSHGPILSAPPTIVTTSPGPILSAPPTIVTTSHGPILAAPPTIVTTSHGPILSAPPNIVTTSHGPILPAPPTIVTTSHGPILAAPPIIVTTSSSPPPALLADAPSHEPILTYNTASVSAGLEYVRTALDMNQQFSDSYFPMYPMHMK